MDAVLKNKIINNKSKSTPSLWEGWDGKTLTNATNFTRTNEP